MNFQSWIRDPAGETQPNSPRAAENSTDLARYVCLFVYFARCNVAHPPPTPFVKTSHCSLLKQFNPPLPTASCIPHSASPGCCLCPSTSPSFLKGASTVFTVLITLQREKPLFPPLPWSEQVLIAQTCNAHTHRSIMLI